jgi:hypothetical protein
MKSHFIPFNFVSNLVLAQSPKSEKVKYVNVIQKCVPVKRTAIGSKEVLSDSRCPEGVRCLGGN